MFLGETGSSTSLFKSDMYFRLGQGWDKVTPHLVTVITITPNCCGQSEVLIEFWIWAVLDFWISCCRPCKQLKKNAMLYKLAKNSMFNNCHNKQL